MIFAYYILLYLAQSVTKGYYAGPDGGAQAAARRRSSRAGRRTSSCFPFGVLALIWRARWAEGRLPFRSLVKLTEARAGWFDRRRDAGDAAAPAAAAGPAARPRAWWSSSASRTCRGCCPTSSIATSARSTCARRRSRSRRCSGIFYISTFIDKSDKLFKGQTTGGTVLQLLGFMTPQFIYYVIPLAALLSVLVTFGLLSRSSELSVMKACGISLYRIAAPLLILSLVWSGVLFGLEQRIMARANEQVDRIDSQIRGRAPRTSNPLSRTWLIGRDGDIYHYTQFDAGSEGAAEPGDLPPGEGRLAAREPAVHAARGLHRQRRVDRHQRLAAGLRRRAAGWAAFPQRTLPLEPPDYFETQQPIAEMMTVPELKRFIDEQAASGFNVVPLTIELQKKLAFPFVTVVMTLLAIPFGMTTGKRGTLYGIGIGIVMALSYWIVGSAFAAIGKAGDARSDHGRLGAEYPRRRQRRVSPADRADLTPASAAGARSPRAPSSGRSPAARCGTPRAARARRSAARSPAGLRARLLRRGARRTRPARGASR